MSINEDIAIRLGSISGISTVEKSMVSFHFPFSVTILLSKIEIPFLKTSHPYHYSISLSLVFMSLFTSFIYRSIIYIVTNVE